MVSVREPRLMGWEEFDRLIFSVAAFQATGWTFTKAQKLRD